MNYKYTSNIFNENLVSELCSKRKLYTIFQTYEKNAKYFTNKFYIVTRWNGNILDMLC